MPVTFTNAKGEDMTATATDRTGDLCDAETRELIREATTTEVIESRVQAWHDGGCGTILVDGRPCYVEGDDDPELEICVSSEWVHNWIEGQVDIDGGEYELKCAADWSTTKLCELLADAGFTTTAAKGGRSTLSGWNGQNVYAFQSGPVGTFAQLGEAEKDKVLALICQAIADTAAEWGVPK